MKQRSFTPSMTSDDSDGFMNEGLGVATSSAKPMLKKPPMYRVVLLNDDYTPMDFVVGVLMAFFRMNQEKATAVMLAVHNKGKGECGIFSRDVAETKAAAVNRYSRESNHPLLCEVEKV